METPSYSTAGTILAQVRAETGIGSNPPSTALQQEALLRVLDDYNDAFANAPYQKGMLGWKFLIGETIIQTKAATTLNGAISSGDSSLILTSGTDFDDPAGSDIGAGYVKSSQYLYDFFTYEDKSSNTLSTVAGLQMDHATSSEVHKLYQLPSDFGKVRALFRESNLYMYEWADSEKTQVPLYPYYMLKTLTSTNNFSATFMVFPEDVGAHSWKLYYAKSGTLVENISTKVNAPDGHGRRWLIHKMNAYVYGVLWEGELMVRHEEMAEREMDQCLTQWAMHHLQPNRSLSFDF